MVCRREKENGSRSEVNSWTWSRLYRLELNHHLFRFGGSKGDKMMATAEPGCSEFLLPALSLPMKEERSRNKERLEASLAGLCELDLLKQRQESRVLSALCLGDSLVSGQSPWGDLRSALFSLDAPKDTTSDDRRHQTVRSVRVRDNSYCLCFCLCDWWFEKFLEVGSERTMKSWIVLYICLGLLFLFFFFFLFLGQMAE